MTDTKVTEGWVFLLNAAKYKWHYVRECRSLCGKWLYLGSTFESGNDDSSDNCPKCKAKLAKI